MFAETTPQKSLLERGQELLSGEWGPQIVTYGGGALKVIVILFVTFLIAKVVSGLASKAFKKAKFDDTLSKFFAKMARWAVLMLGVLTCLSIFGIETTSFAAVIGAAGLAMGLAFQGTLGNFASGVMLLIFRPFKVGQFITVNGFSGTVNEIELFTTTLDTTDNRRVILPNGSVFGAPIENVGHHDTRRVEVNVGCCYQADIDLTRRVLEKAAQTLPGILLDPEPCAVLCALGASSVDWQVRVWCRSSDYWAVKDSLTRAVKISLDQSGISIPYNQLDININQATVKAVA